METIQTKKTNIKKIDLVEKLLILKNVKSIFNKIKKLSMFLFFSLLI